MANSSKNIDSDPIRLLIVDDEKDFVNILSKRIKRRNIDVAKAFSGAEAIQALRGQEFDVAVLDLKMEDMDGIEVLKMLKIMDPKLAVIMLTGHGSATIAVDPEAAGARVGLLTMQAPDTVSTLQDYRELLVEQLATGMMNQRLAERSQEADSNQQILVTEYSMLAIDDA